MIDPNLAASWKKDLEDATRCLSTKDARIAELESKLDAAEKQLIGERRLGLETAHDWANVQWDYEKRLKELESRLSTALNLLERVKKDLLDRGSMDSGDHVTVVNLSSTLWNSLCDFLVERRDPFDEAIERDAKAGKLDGLIAEAKERLGE